MNNKILLAEDDDNIRKLVTSYLEEEGYHVLEAKDGGQAIEIFSFEEELCCVILDIMMPIKNGLEICTYIRSFSSEIPIIMLTALDSSWDELKGFNCGADEYISKPFNRDILMTRIKKLLARSGRDVLQSVEVGTMRISLRERNVTIEEKSVFLTPKEFDLLYYLAVNKNIALTRDQILENVWDLAYGGDDRTVDTHIKCLRAKIGIYGDNIKTIRKVGYKFEVK